MKKEKISSGKLYKIFVYVALITLAISIIVPVIWVFMSSLKTNAEFREVHGHYLLVFIFKTLLMLLKKPIWLNIS